MKKIFKYLKRIFAITLVSTVLLGAIPALGLEGLGDFITLATENTDEHSIDNGYIEVTVSDRNGGFGIRTVDGDKVNKDDNNKYLLFEYDEDNTSFTSFQVERNGEVKEYIFGGKYVGSSDVVVSKVEESLVAVWAVDDLTFTQTITLVNSGANEHGMANISYMVENTGDPAEVKVRILMDTALGYQDYAYYSVGDSVSYVESETTVDASGYNKAFYAVDNISAPSITAYTVNASVNNVECKPYKTTFAHWNNLAATVFDYTVDANMTFTNPYNKSYLTADSAYALYFDMEEVAQGSKTTISTNYGIFSNEDVEIDETVAINLIAPSVLQLTEDKTAYENNGKFSVKTSIENISNGTYEKVRVLVYTSGGIDALNQLGEPSNGTYDNPYYIDIAEFKAGENKVLDWNFIASPKESAQYAKIQYKVYDISDDATLGTGAIMKENLLGEGSSYVLCPGSVDQIPKVKFTGSTPDILYTEGVRTLYITGDNFSMLLDKNAYKLMLSRVDGNQIHGKDSVEIPSGNLTIEDANNTLTVMLTDDAPGKLAEGMYQLTFDYTDEGKDDISAPALRFQVKNDVKYKNDAYGFLAVVKEEKSTDNFTYKIINYLNEADYKVALQKGEIDRRNVLLEFRGSFIKEDKDTSDDMIAYKGVSLNDNDNIMTLNDCLDIKNGSAIVTENDGSVTVDFDADIYTTGAGTSVWSGVCALTELEAGEEYGLIPYDENGNREEFHAQTITLLWPSVGQGFQNIMGMLFELKYGELGVIEDEEHSDNDTRVVAFGAALDLSFIIPASIDYKVSNKDLLGDSWNAALHNEVKFSPEEIRALNKRCNYKTDTVNTNETDWKSAIFGETATDTEGDASGGDMDAKSASIQIDDILYGGKCLGVKFAVALGIPGYVEGMPALEAILSVNTIGDWSIGASGASSFATFFLEGSIQIMSKDGIPIPDTLTFYMGGVVPGINLDCFGILWLQGAGGGIENLYDTIFLEDAIPPLKLIIEAEMSVMQVISARASLGLSLRGIDVSLSNGRLANAVPVLNYAGITFEWYPEFYFLGNVQISIYDAIQGAGYIVAEESGFFEFFLRAALQIPSSIPAIGGLNVADAGLGANGDRIWGHVSALSIPFGITYYWGDSDVDWSAGSSVKPTYPELVGMDDGSGLAVFNMGRNEETGENLYAVFGTNLMKTAASNMSLYNSRAGINDEITTDITATQHTMTLEKNGCGKLLIIEWNADSEISAKLDANQITIKDNSNKAYPLNFLDHAQDDTSTVNAVANANLTYDADAKKATLAVSFTNASVYGKTWYIDTPVEASLVLYDVESLPTLSEETSVDVSNDDVTVTLKGDKLENFSTVSFMIEGGDMQEGRLAYRVTETIIDGKMVSFEMPEEVSSGDYTLKIIAQDGNEQYYSEVEKTITYVNKNQPKAPVIDDVACVGNYKVAVSMDIDAVSDDFDGYMITAYDKDGNVVSGVSNVHYYKDGTAIKYNEDGAIAASSGAATEEGIVVGGHYEYPYTNSETGEEEIRITGFEEGDYTVEVRRWKFVSNGVGMLYSKAETADIQVKKPVNTVVDITPVLADGMKSQMVTVTLGDESYQQMVVNCNVVALTLTSDTEAFTGKWKLDGGTRANTSGEISDLTKEATLAFGNLSEGTHTFSLVGKNEYGDTLAVNYVFSVDSQGPRLMLDAPLNGSTFDYKSGVLTISGITDKDALLTVVDKDTNEVVIENAPISNIDERGRFTTQVTLDASILSHELDIIVSDALGNTTEKTVTVVSDGLGSIEDLMIYAGRDDITNYKVAAGTTYTLKLFAKLKGTDIIVELNDADLIEWNQVVVEGTAEIQQSGATATVVTSEGAEGMITANYIINDAGVYSVSAAFGDTGDSIKLLTEDNTIINIDDQYYTGGVIKPAVEVWNDGVLLEEGVDYQVVYKNNTKVSTGSATKPQVEIIGINRYKGTLIEQFEISYLPMDNKNPFYIISGVEGQNDYYISDVSIVPKDGYEIVHKLKTINIMLTEDRNHVVEFSVRRIMDGALTDKVTVELKLDKTAPIGEIELEGSIWNEFFSMITFGHFQLNSNVVTITAEDAASGLADIMYVISEKAYTSVGELETANLNWKKYNDAVKPSILEDVNQIIYVKAIDNAGNVHYISSEGIHEDTVAPIISNLLIKEDDTLTSNSLEFTFVSNEVGTYYYAVVKAGQTPPTAEEVKTLNFEGAKIGSGNITPEMLNKEISIAVNGLDASTLYVVYLVVEDATISFLEGTSAANISEVINSDPVSTKAVPKIPTADTTNPVSWIVLLVTGMLMVLLGLVICKKNGRKCF